MTIAVNDPPCKGLKVVEFATMVSGPFAGQMLADLGAEVIKVEPLTGDPMRAMRPRHKDLSAYFQQINRSKKSIALDLKNPEDLQAARALTSEADVVLENFRPGTMDKLGLGYAELSKDNPGLIFASINGFGSDGPYLDRPAYDHVIQGMCGVMHQFASFTSDGVPMPIYNPIADKLASTTLAQGILAALLARERNGGTGQTVTVSLLDAFATIMLPDLMINHTFQHEGHEQIGNINIHHPIATADGYVIGHVQLDKQFEALCQLCGREELIGEDRFKDSWSRISRYGEMWKEIEKGTRNFGTRDLIDRAAKAGVPLAPVNAIEDFFADPQVRHARTWFDIEDPDYGTIRNLKYPVAFGLSKLEPCQRGPRFDEHGDEVRAGLG